MTYRQGAKKAWPRTAAERILVFGTFFNNAGDNKVLSDCAHYLGGMSEPAGSHYTCLNMELRDSESKWGR